MAHPAAREERSSFFSVLFVQFFAYFSSICSVSNSSQIPAADAWSLFLRPAVVKARADAPAESEAAAKLDAVLAALDDLAKASPVSIGDMFDEVVDLLRRSPHGRKALGANGAGQGDSPRASMAHSSSASNVNRQTSGGNYLYNRAPPAGLELSVKPGATRSSAYLLNRWRQRVDEDLRRMQDSALIE